MASWFFGPWQISEKMDSQLTTWHHCTPLKFTPIFCLVAKASLASQWVLPAPAPHLGWGVSLGYQPLEDPSYSPLPTRHQTAHPMTPLASNEGFWEAITTLYQQFLTFIIEHKTNFEGESSARPLVDQTYSRYKRRASPVRPTTTTKHQRASNHSRKWTIREKDKWVFVIK